MAKSFGLRLLRNNLGQSAVEYILLLAVLSSLGYSFYNNKLFKSFLNGKSGMFAAMKQGMSYSYRYGIEFKNGTDFDTKMNFEYSGRDHDLYYNGAAGTSRFFSGNVVFPKK